MADETDKIPVPAPSARPRPTRSVTGGLALLLSLVALIGVVYLWYLMSYKSDVVGIDVAHRLQTQGQRLARIDTELQALKQERQADQRLLRTVERREESLANRHQGGHHFEVRAAEDLLLIANDQLRFEHDVPLALLALHQAERTLRRQADPRLLPVRTAILQEILRLKAVRSTHTSTMALELVALAHSVQTLPLAVPRPLTRKPAQAPQRVAEPFWRRAVHGIWQDFTTLIRIHKIPIHEQALLAPKRAYFLRQNLALRLYAAQLALLEHHPAVMRADLAASAAWVTQYFDGHSRSVQTVLAHLHELQAKTAKLAWPDISHSLHLLRALARTGS